MPRFSSREANAPPDLVGGPLATVQEVNTTVSPSGLLFYICPCHEKSRTQVWFEHDICEMTAAQAGIDQKVVGPWSHAKATTDDAHSESCPRPRLDPNVQLLQVRVQRLSSPFTTQTVSCPVANGDRFYGLKLIGQRHCSLLHCRIIIDGRPDFPLLQSTVQDSPSSGSRIISAGSLFP